MLIPVFGFSIPGGGLPTSAPRYKNAPLPRLGEEVFGGTPPGPPLSVFVFSKEEEERRKKKEERRPCMHTCTPLCERVPWHDRTHQRAALIQAQSQHQARAAACRIASSFCARIRPPAECRRAACPHALQDGAGCAAHVRLIVSSSEAQSPSRGKLKAMSVYTIT